MISLPQKVNIIKQEGNRAVFEVEGCYPGYGITFGNAIRRVLLSSLPGAAITNIKIKGVDHEFSTLPHVAEDVIEIILNLKQLRFRLAGNEKYRLTLKASGEKDVMSSDIKLPSEVELINDDIHIAILTDKKAALEMEMDVEIGLGYSPVEQRKKEKLEIGVIPIDALFSPVKKVNFEVENMRVGDRTDYNRLILDLETDGSLTPSDALRMAAAILVEQFGAFIEIGKKKEPLEKEKPIKGENGVKEPIEDPAKISVDDLKISTRVLNALKEAGIKSVGGLIKKNESALLEIEGMGDKGLKEIKRVLSKMGLELKEEK